MQLFHNTNYDFLKWKWPSILASVALSLVGIASLVVKGGPAYGIDFKGGAEMKVRFKTPPPVEDIRASLATKIKGEISVVQETSGGGNQLLIGTEIADENQLNANRDLIEASLRDMFNAGETKPDLNNLSSEKAVELLRGALPSLSEPELQDLVRAIKAYSVSKGGIIASLDDLTAVNGVTPAAMTAIKDTFSAGPFAIVSADVVGPKIGAELRQKAIYATLAALGGMLIFIAFRFEWIYGVAAVLAVFHDTVITVGLFSLANKEISLTVIAALLTLVGYSMNDTIVIFDRIRENLKTNRRDSLANVINLSINQTLSRTIMTSGLTFLTAMALWLFGGEVLNGFSFALVVGILIGTYSSVFVASPILVFWQNFSGSKKPVPVAVPVKREKVIAGGRAAKK